MNSVSMPSRPVSRAIAARSVTTSLETVVVMALDPTGA
jgi:hypothetical protein